MGSAGSRVLGAVVARPFCIRKVGGSIPPGSNPSTYAHVRRTFVFLFFCFNHIFLKLITVDRLSDCFDFDSNILIIWCIYIEYSKLSPVCKLQLFRFRDGGWYV